MEVSKEDRVYYNDVFKHRIIQEVLIGKISKEEARRRYRIKGKSAIQKWMLKFGYTPKVDSITLSMKSKKIRSSTLPNDSQELKHRIIELEKALEEANLNSEFYSTMINIAEKEFKISIRKKLFTKQSNK